MKLQIGQGYLLVISPSLVKWWGRLSTGTFEAKGMAFFPLLFVRDESVIQPWLITHECIHLRQQLETLFLGLIILSLLERLYARFFLGMNRMEQYLYTAAEQEAYLHMHDSEYLNARAVWSVFRHVFNKKSFRLIGPGEIEFLD